MSAKSINKKSTYKFVILAEKISIFFLRLKGYEILQWRYKTRFGEIDIIAKKARVIIFFEVKARKEKSLIEEVLLPQQIERIKKAAEFFISKNSQFQNYDLRLDFIEVGKFFIIKHYKNFIS